MSCACKKPLLLLLFYTSVDWQRGQRAEINVLQTLLFCFTSLRLILSMVYFTFHPCKVDRNSCKILVPYNLLFPLSSYINSFVPYLNLQHDIIMKTGMVESVVRLTKYFLVNSCLLCSESDSPQLRLPFNPLGDLMK